MNTWTIFHLYVAGLATFVWYRFLQVLSWPGQTLSWLIGWLRFFMVWIIPSWLKAAWRWVIAHKVRILWMVLLSVTIAGGAAAIYLWRREISNYLIMMAERILDLIRGFFQHRATVIVASFPEGRTEPVTTVVEQ